MRALHLLATFAAVLAACAASAPASPPPAAPSAPSPSATTMSAFDAGASPPTAGSAFPASTTQTDLVVTLPRSAADAAAEVEPPPTVSSDSAPSACQEQPPQDFLVRGNFLKMPGGNLRAIQYRTDTYGYFNGFGRPGPGAEPPSHYAVDTTFMGLKVRMHRKVVPALACVEAEIKRACGHALYTPHALAGIRFRNTYRGGEVTNHIYGIAIDVDPGENPCCGCVKPWSDAPACEHPAKTEYDRMALPECWVHAFEKYGFYWLGHDVLRDTMHFEFLGDPDRIVRSAPTNR